MSVKGFKMCFSEQQSKMPDEFSELFHRVCLNIDSPVHHDSEWEMWICSQWPSGYKEGEGCWPGACSVGMLMLMLACTRQYQNTLKLTSDEIGPPCVILTVTCFRMNIWYFLFAMPCRLRLIYFFSLCSLGLCNPWPSVPSGDQTAVLYFLRCIKLWLKSVGRERRLPLCRRRLDMIYSPVLVSLTLGGCLNLM